MTSAAGGGATAGATAGASAGASSTLQHDDCRLWSHQPARATLGGTWSVPGAPAVAELRRCAVCRCGARPAWGGAAEYGERWGAGTVVGRMPARVGVVAPSMPSRARHSSFLDSPLPLSCSGAAPARSDLCEAKRIWHCAYGEDSSRLKSPGVVAGRSQLVAAGTIAHGAVPLLATVNPLFEIPPVESSGGEVGGDGGAEGPPSCCRCSGEAGPCCRYMRELPRAGYSRVAGLPARGGSAEEDILHCLPGIDWKWAALAGIRCCSICVKSPARPGMLGCCLRIISTRDSIRLGPGGVLLPL